MEQEPMFRASKRKKAIKPKASGEDELEGNVLSRNEDGHGNRSSDEDDRANQLRMRRQTKPRGFGIQFSNIARSGHQDNSGAMALTTANSTTDRTREISNRFVGTTGHIVDVDKHMMAYIETEMTKRKTDSTVATGARSTDEVDIMKQTPTLFNQNHEATDSHRTMNRLPEVDLGFMAHETNLARTEAAIARAQAGLPPMAEEAKPPKPRKPRIGRDGKPMRPRPRKRRNSEDVARDALVEQVLHEHKLEIYDEAKPNSNDQDHGGEAIGGNADADEQLAEKFRQEFMDNMAERRNKQKVTNQPKGPGAAKVEKGPRLGGSRSARAKMAQLQQQESAQAPQTRQN